jgi:hypothetical protein
MFLPSNQVASCRWTDRFRPWSLSEQRSLAGIVFATFWLGKNALGRYINKRVWVRRMRKGLFGKYLTYVLALGWTLFAAADASWCENRAPIFDPAASCFLAEPDTGGHAVKAGAVEGGTFTTCYVRENQAIEVYVHADDPDGDPVVMSLLNGPGSALFRDQGDGNASLLWKPDFIGPWSSAQSPFVFFFVASDGTLSTRLRVVINVINVNRSPELTLPEPARVAAGNDLVFQVRKYDPDLEEVSVKAVNLPSGAEFEPESGIFTWNPQEADTGLWPLTFRATDGSGGSCQGQTEVSVTPPSTFGLRLGVSKSILGGTAEVPITLANSEAIGGMELLIQYDPTAFTFLEAIRQGTRCQSWEYFYCHDRPVGLYRQVKIVGFADFPNQVSTVPLLPDSGVIALLRFKVTNDPYLAGLLIPLELHCFDFTDNTLSTPDGRFIKQDEVNLSNGGVLLSAGNTLLGDINQNGIAYEVGDAVKLVAHLSETSRLTLQQLINSDVNQDGRMGTLTDLVVLIQRILEEQTVPQDEGDGSEEPALVRITDEGSQTFIQLESDKPMGGALLVFKEQDLSAEDVEVAGQAGEVEVYTLTVGDEFRVLLMGRDAKPLPVGDHLISLKRGHLEMAAVSLADCQGELVGAKPEYEKGSRPTRFALGQNYPNPFNPSTSISYYVGTETAVRVSLRVYNLAGQLVKTLVDEEKAPGEHQVIWDGKNQQGDDVASGVYFYRLSVMNFSDSRRMVLLK